MDRSPRPQAHAGRKLDPVELRITNLRRELEADPDPNAKAAILYHIGSSYEHDLGRTADAMRSYREALEAAPTFEPAMIATMRIAERSDDPRDLEAALACTAAISEPSEGSTAALLDRALRSESWATLLEEAIARSAAPAVPALILEWLSEAAGDRDSLGRALRAQAEHASDPELRGALWLDLALHESEQGEIDAALQTLERASGCEAVAWSARGLQRRLAKEHSRFEVLVRAVTSMAILLENAAAQEAVDPLRLPVAPQQRLPLAALLWQEAAKHCANALGDWDAAAGYLESAARLAPNDLQTRLQALCLAELHGGEGDLELASAWFRETAPEHPAFVALRIRRSSTEHEARALAVLREVAAAYPESDYARAALDVALMQRQAHEELAQRFRDRSATGDEQARQLYLWRAALLSPAPGSDQQSDLSQAASSSAAHQVRILQDALGLALEAQRGDAIVARCEELLDCSIARRHEDELGFTRYDATRHVLLDDSEADRLLRHATEDSSQKSWAPHLARVRSALGDDPGWLAQAHEALAGQSTGGLRSAHLCAAGAAHARASDWSAAQQSLESAREISPDDPYLRALLQTVLRDSGQPERVVALAREQALPDALAEQSLLLAGADAERDGKLDVAQEAYQQALALAPGSVSAALALADLARRRSDAGGRLQAYARLAEGSLEGGAAELFALVRGDALGFDPRVAEEAALSYDRALGHPATASSAAVSLLSMPATAISEDVRASAEAALGDVNDVTGSDGFGSAYAALQASLGHPRTSAADAWLELSAAAPTEGLRAQALLQATRTTRITAGEQAVDELFVAAQETLHLERLAPEAASLLDECLAPGDDPELRASALQEKLENATAVDRGAISAAYCRALVEADRGAEAVALLSASIEERPDDLSIWETLRVAARQAEQWALVAQACERLAQFVEGSLQADLLEEAAIVRLDHLDQDQQAEDLLRSALQADPARELAFRRLHDLLAEKQDAEALEALVSTRLARGGSEDRPELLYERARLLRGFSDRPGALEALDELFATEPEHAGALALAAEVNVSLERWEDAVRCLQRLAASKIPDEQRRLAHLGAADFLEGRLGDPERALGELLAIESLGLADAEIWARIGALQEATGHPEAATDAYGRALRADPIHSAAIAGLARCLDGAQRDEAVHSYETALWDLMSSGKHGAGALQDLADAATWRGHLERTAVIRAVQRALGGDSANGDAPRLPVRGVSLDELRETEASPLLDELLRRVGSSLFKPRARSKKVAASDPVYAELESICEQLGARMASVGMSAELSSPAAHGGPDGEIHWLVPAHTLRGLDARSRFIAGRLAWAVPRGAGWLLDGSASSAAGKIGALVRAARCQVDAGDTALPAAEVKLRRAERRSVQQVLGDTVLGSAQLLSFARGLQRTADRAGLLACEDAEAALASVLGGVPSLASLESSARAMALARFCMDPDSLLWSCHARG